MPFSALQRRPLGRPLFPRRRPSTPNQGENRTPSSQRGTRWSYAPAPYQPPGRRGEERSSAPRQDREERELVGAGDGGAATAGSPVSSSSSRRFAVDRRGSAGFGRGAARPRRNPRLASSRPCKGERRGTEGETHQGLLQAPPKARRRGRAACRHAPRRGGGGRRRLPRPGRPRSSRCPRGGAPPPAAAGQESGCILTPACSRPSTSPHAPGPP
jgi:hypothetical protein